MRFRHCCGLRHLIRSSSPQSQSRIRRCSPVNACKCIPMPPVTSPNFRVTWGIRESPKVSYNKPICHYNRNLMDSFFLASKSSRFPGVWPRKLCHYNRNLMDSFFLASESSRFMEFGPSLSHQEFRITEALDHHNIPTGKLFPFQSAQNWIIYCFNSIVNSSFYGTHLLTTHRSIPCSASSTSALLNALTLHGPKFARISPFRSRPRK
jgi:hypothetical protein